MHVTEGIVILFSGAVKTADSAQDCAQVRPHFRLANRLTKAIDKAIRDGDIFIDDTGKELLFDHDFELVL